MAAEGTNGHAPDASVPLPPYPERFYAAARYAAIPGTVDFDPETEHAVGFSDLTSLMLYSLYQQAAFGPCTTQKPWSWNIVENAKWASWKELGNMAPVEAMRLFVRTLEEEEPQWWAKANCIPPPSTAPAAPPKAEAPKVPIEGAASDRESKFEVDFDAHSELAPSLQAVAVGNWVLPAVTGRRPFSRYQHAAAVLGNKMVVVGGNSNGRYLSDVQVLDLTKMQWAKVEPSDSSEEQLPPCAGHAVLVQDSTSVFMVAGLTKDKAEKVVVRVYDVSQNTWTVVKTRGQVPSARGGCSAVLAGGAIWLFGGEDMKRRLQNDVYMLDLSTMVWEAVETSGAAPGPRSDHVAALIAGGRHMAVFGGGSHSICYNDIYVLDLETYEWTQPEVHGDVLPVPRAGHAAALVGSKWYIVGGGDNKGGVAETMVLDTETWEWSAIATAPPRTPIASEGLSLATVGGPEQSLLLAFGGYNGKYSNEVYVLKPADGGTAQASGYGQPAQAAAPAGKGGSAAEKPLSSADAGTAPGADGPASKEPAKAASLSGPASAPAPDGDRSQGGAEAGGGRSDREAELEQQLEEALEKMANAEKVALNARAEAQLTAGKARADAWSAIGKAKADEEELKEKLAAALKARAAAETEVRNAAATVTNAQAQAQGAAAEAGQLRKDLADARHQLSEAQELVAKVQENSELSKLQRDFGTVKKALADTEQELLSARSSLANEQARCFRLEVEVAEYRQRLSSMADLEKELEVLRRQKAASDEAAAKGGRSWW